MKFLDVYTFKSSLGDYNRVGPLFQTLQKAVQLKSVKSKQKLRCALSVTNKQQPERDISVVLLHGK